MMRRQTFPSARSVRVRAPGIGGAWVTRVAAAIFCVAAAIPALGAAPEPAAAHDVRLPLHDGKVRMSDVGAVLCREFKLGNISVPAGEFDLQGGDGPRFVTALNASLGEGCCLSLVPGAVVFHVEPAKLPSGCERAQRAARALIAIESPKATAALGQLYGLHLPERVDVRVPLVILIHGLDCNIGVWGEMSGRLQAAGYQVGLFGYPSDGPIDDSARLLTDEMTRLRVRYPGLDVSFVCHSMGGLVARDYIEGPHYRGGVSHLIMVGTPNAGSKWVRYHLALKAQQQYFLWKYQPDWSVTWAITDGVGEAADDLHPGSPFLKSLNARPRRDGVKYTIVAGNHHPADLIEADWVETVAGWAPTRVSGWWGIRQCRTRLIAKAETLRAAPCDCDGPVTLESARLTGVNDYQIVPADHASLVWGLQAAAWPIIKDRLGR